MSDRALEFFTSVILTLVAIAVYVEIKWPSRWRRRRAKVHAPAAAAAASAPEPRYHELDHDPTQRPDYYVIGESYTLGHGIERLVAMDQGGLWLAPIGARTWPATPTR